MNVKKLLVWVLCFTLLLSLPLFGKTVTLTLLQQDVSPHNEEDVAFMNYLTEGFKKATGIDLKVEIVPIPAGNYAEKVTLLLAGGTYPDIIWWRDDAELPYVDQGLLLDLSGRVNASAVFQEKMPDWNKQRMANFPYLLWISPLQTRMAVVRKEWLEESGINPVTVDDYYNLLKFFKQKSGKYGITVTNDLSRLNWIFDAAFGVNQMWIKDNNGKWVFSKMTQGEKDKLAFYAKLFKEGLLDQEFITVGWQSMEDKFYSSQVGMLVATAGTVMDLYQKRFWDRGIETELVPLYPPIGPSGKANFTALNLDKEARGYSITVTCKEPDIAFKFLEFMATDEGQYLDRLGMPGREYNIVNGEIVKTERGEGWWPRFFEVPSWNAPVALYGKPGKASLEIAHALFEGDNYFLMPQRYATQWDAMNNLYKEYSIKIVTNQFPIEKFDEMVQLWYKAGGDLYTQLANEHFKNK
ncbi:MAG: extracellular solute-binding protein [Thermotogae bacterium]|nr:extracellular solute-binding protein [Thermotogota bacterium]